MFQGTLPKPVIKIIGNIVKEWDVKRIYVGCSGNFTIERSISNIVNCPITSNDVTIYSSYLGKWFAGQDLKDLHVREGFEEKYGIFSDYMKTDIDKVATLILASDMLSYDKPGAYFKRMYQAYEMQFPRMHKEFVEKLSNIETKIDSFYHGDVMELLDMVDPKCDGFISFPPFYSGGYEKMWSKIEEVFFYERPEYKQFDPNLTLSEFCEKVRKIDRHIIGTEREVKSLSDELVGKSETLQHKTIYLYGKSTKTHYIDKSWSRANVKSIVKIGKDYKLSGDIKIKIIGHDQFLDNRQIYLSKMIKSGDGYHVTIGLYDGEYCFGFIALNNGQRQDFGDCCEEPHVTLLCDFAVSPTSIKKLSKLVLYCALSKEVQLICDRFIKNRVKTISTTVISKSPASMKYRGLFDLINTKLVKDSETGEIEKYILTYIAKPGQWTLKEGYEKWKQKCSR